MESKNSIIRSSSVDLGSHQKQRECHCKLQVQAIWGDRSPTSPFAGSKGLLARRWIRKLGWFISALVSMTPKSGGLSLETL